MGLVSFISKGRQVVFQARTARARPIRKTKIAKAKARAPKRVFSRQEELSRIGQAEQAIRNARKAKIPFTKRQERELRITAVTGSRPVRRSRKRTISNNSSDFF